MCGNARGSPSPSTLMVILSSKTKINLLDPCGKDLLVGLAPSSLSFYG